MIHRRELLRAGLGTAGALLLARAGAGRGTQGRFRPLRPDRQDGPDHEQDPHRGREYR